MHIGLIGGIGPAATDYYYRGLIERHAKSNTTLDLTIVHADLRQLAQNRADRNAQRQAEIFLRLIQRLAAAGAELAGITSMGGHFCVEELKKISPLPILNAIPEVEAAVRRRNLKTVGILGTRAVATAYTGHQRPTHLRSMGKGYGTEIVSTEGCANPAAAARPVCPTFFVPHLPPTPLRSR